MKPKLCLLDYRLRTDPIADRSATANRRTGVELAKHTARRAPAPATN